MKKQLLLSAAGLLCAATLAAQTDTFARDTITASWATAFGGKGADSPGQISSNAGGETYVTFDFASYAADASRWTAFGTDTIYGFPSTATNGNHNFGMYRLDADGTRQLTVYSDQGYWDRASSGMMATADGGAILALKMRNADAVSTTVDGHKYLLRLYTSADPEYCYTITEDTMPTDQGWIYRGYVLKLDRDGKVQWQRNMWTDTTPAATANGSKLRSNMFDFADAVQGPDGCYYVTGMFAAPLYIEGRAGSLTPTNIPDYWDYDFVQNPAGDLFLTKFDANGNYCWTMTHDAAETSATYENVMEMDVDNEAVYLMGYTEGNDEGTDKLTFDGKTVNIPSSRSHLFYMRVPCTENASATDETVKVSYLKLLEGRIYQGASRDFSRIQPISLDVSGGLVLMGGAFNGYIYDGDNMVLEKTANTLTGYVIAADAATGERKGAFSSESFVRSISQVQHATVVGDSVYVSGYDMYNNTGGWLAALDKATFTTHTVYSVFRGGGMATTWGGTVVDGNRYIFLGRGRMSSASYLFNVTGVGTVGTAGNDWECLAVGFDLPGVDAEDPGSGTGIAPVGTADTGLQVWTSAGGQLTVRTDEPCTVRVLNAAGATVATFEAGTSATTVRLPNGFYIVNGKKVIVR